MEISGDKEGRVAESPSQHLCFRYYEPRSESLQKYYIARDKQEAANRASDRVFKSATALLAEKQVSHAAMIRSCLKNFADLRHDRAKASAFLFRKSNWDLKLGIQKKLHLLEKRTMKSMVQLAINKSKAEQADAPSILTAVHLAEKQQEQVEHDEEGEDSALDKS